MHLNIPVYIYSTYGNILNFENFENKPFYDNNLNEKGFPAAKSYASA